MSLRITLATARRMLGQVRADPRTIALMLVVPVRAHRAAGLGVRRQPAPVFDHIGAPCSGSSRSS